MDEDDLTGQFGRAWDGERIMVQTGSVPQGRPGHGTMRGARYHDGGSYRLNLGTLDLEFTKGRFTNKMQRRYVARTVSWMSTMNGFLAIRRIRTFRG